MTSPVPSLYVAYTLKRPTDVLIAASAFLLTLPLQVTAIMAVWLCDRGNPFYISPRVGLNGRSFRFIKIRTMIARASANVVDTTVAGDPRVTSVGRWIRVLKIDELPQLLHVLSGQMSMVGPRPNVPREVALYTPVEQTLLAVRPGITDIASIVFADLADALANVADPNEAYRQLVRPWKSRLGLHYLRCASWANDLRILWYTVAVFVARRWTLRKVSALLHRTGASEDLCRFVLRDEPLRPVVSPETETFAVARSREKTGAQ